jgi:copper(I)-binding protein
MPNTFKWIPAILLMGMAACNNSGGSSATSDSTAAKDSTAKDTAMKMTSVDPLPPIPAGAKVYFKNVKDGEKVSSPLKLEFGVDGIALDTAGTVKLNSGHHHLLIDAGDSIPSGQVVPKDSTHLHFGKAQTGVTVTLTPGKHTLALQYADGIHRSYGSQLSAVVTVDVKK